MVVHRTAPIIIAKTPTKFSPASISPQCFIGNWHRGHERDHIWAGGGTSALSFTFDEPIKAIEIILRGKPAPGVGPDGVVFRAFGGAAVQVTPDWAQNSVRFVFSDDNPFQSSTIILDVPEPIFIEGDSRLLGFVLFNVDVSRPAIPEKQVGD